MMQFKKHEDGSFRTTFELRPALTAPELVDVFVASGSKIDEIESKEQLAELVQTTLQEKGVAALSPSIQPQVWADYAGHVAKLLPKDRAIEIAMAIVERMSGGGTPKAKPADEEDPF